MSEWDWSDFVIWFIGCFVVGGIVGFAIVRRQILKNRYIQAKGDLNNFDEGQERDLPHSVEKTPWDVVRVETIETGIAITEGYCYACPDPIQIGDRWKRERIGNSVPHAFRLVHDICPRKSEW